MKMGENYFRCLEEDLCGLETAAQGCAGHLGCGFLTAVSGQE
jgi:hypothetical protein